MQCETKKLNGRGHDSQTRLTVVVVIVVILVVVVVIVVGILVNL